MFALETKRLLTVKVGPGATGAQYRVDDPAAMVALLREALS